MRGSAAQTPRGILAILLSQRSTLSQPQALGGFAVKHLVWILAALLACVAFASAAQATDVSYVLQTPGVV